MLLHEVLQLSGLQLLPFLLVLHVVIVSHDLIARLPVELHDVAHVLALALQLKLVLASQPLLSRLLLVQVLLRCLDELLGISALLFGLLLEVVRHPLHLLEEEFPV